MGSLVGHHLQSLPLYGAVGAWSGEPFVARVTRNRLRPTALRSVEVLVTDEITGHEADGFRAALVLSEHRPAARISGTSDTPTSWLDQRLGYLDDGDVVRVNPSRGELSVLFRRGSPHNSIFVTERCNNSCVMCSQPPRKADDSYRLRDWLTAIPLISRDTDEIGITGGEPTLLGDGFVELVRALKVWLPQTRLHVLSNGRLFQYVSLAQATAQVRHPDITIAVPIFSDLPEVHDYVVQHAGAFDETIRGILNLNRCGIRVEVRVVIQQANVARLDALARFLVVNLPFVGQVSLMALEPMGFAKANSDTVWVDPADYGPALKSATLTLSVAGLNPVIMNHQLCVLDRQLWPYAAKSISDYKNVFLSECCTCAVKDRCAGFFASASTRHSAHISPIQPVT